MAPDPDRAARLVADVLSWTTGGEELDQLDAHALERWLWYELPTKWMVDGEERREVLDVMAEALTAAGRERMAERCVEPQTLEVLAAWDRDRAAGRAAFIAASDRSPSTPPDLEPAGDFPGLTWGGTMGIVEASAHSHVGAVLGRAWERGELTAGGRGWRAVQQRVAREALSAPGSLDDAPGRTLLEQVLEDRLDRWTTHVRSPQTTALRRAVADLLRDPPAPPSDLVVAQPLHQLLQLVDEGVTLTERFYLPPGFVRELAAEHGWGLEGFPGRGEADEPLVAELHEMARRMKLVRRRKRALHLTTLGRRALEDDDVRWQVACTSWVGGDDFDAHVCELALAVTLTEGLATASHDDMRHRILGPMTEQGWSFGQGQAVGPQDIGWALGAFWRRGVIHGFTGPRFDGALTDLGRVAAVTALRARATGPGQSPFG